MNRAQSHNIYVIIALIILGILWFFVARSSAQPKAASTQLQTNEDIREISCSDTVSQALLLIAYNPSFHSTSPDSQTITAINECVETECSNHLYSGLDITRDAFITCFTRARLSCGYDIPLPFDKQSSCAKETYCGNVMTRFGEVCASKSIVIANTNSLEQQAHNARIDIVELNGIIKLIKDRLRDITAAIGQILP